MCNSLTKDWNEALHKLTRGRHYTNYTLYVKLYSIYVCVYMCVCVEWRAMGDVSQWLTNHLERILAFWFGRKNSEYEGAGRAWVYRCNFEDYVVFTCFLPYVLQLNCEGVRSGSSCNIGSHPGHEFGWGEVHTTHTTRATYILYNSGQRREHVLARYDSPTLHTCAHFSLLGRWGWRWRSSQRLRRGCDGR